ncbi:MAG TPA: transposase [Geomonas sp.]|nr:transposase [Geomonas sp.]
MARPLRIEFEGAFYHVTARGDEQKDIFKSGRDRQRFLEYLLAGIERYGIVVHCYCLMTNHYHLFLQTPLANLSQAMRHLNGSYTTYFNVKRKHVGHLFQGRYRAIVVDADEYAIQLSRYMHLNPVRARIVNAPEDYPWSSYRAYVGEVEPPPWLNRRLVLGNFCSNIAESEIRYKEFVEDLAGKEYISPLNNTVASTVLGNEHFVETIMEGCLEGKEERPDVPAVRGLHHRFNVEQINPTDHSEGQ